MKYYSVRDSLDIKIVGTYPQADEALYDCDVWSEPKFIDRVKFEKVDFQPITAKAILKKKSKLTDFISTGNIGFSLKLLVSGKLKSILEDSRDLGFQFYRSPIIYKGKEIEDYWVLNFYQIDMEFIDFTRSDIFLIKKTFTKLEKLTINNYVDYLDKKREVELKGYPYGIRIEKLRLVKNPNQDFFVLLDVEGGAKYIVSEQLKKEIEEAGCTGIEFMPSDLSLNEWLQGGEREKIYGKV